MNKNAKHTLLSPLKRNLERVFLCPKVMAWQGPNGQLPVDKLTRDFIVFVFVSGCHPIMAATLPQLAANTRWHTF
jgi:hypothetical protein